MIVACEHIQKLFHEEVVLKDAHFHIEEREKVGLVGNNGTGKTTLFRIIAKELEPDSGQVAYAKNCSLGYLKQNADFDSKLTVYEELLQVFKDVIALEKQLQALELKIAETGSIELTHEYDRLRLQFEDQKGYEYQSLVKGILKGLGFDHTIYDKPISILSGGQKTRIALAKLLLEEPSVLLLDEPTNHLDIAAIEWLENFLRSYKGAVIIISHDRYFLDKIVTKIVHLEFGKSYTYQGNYSDFIIKSAAIYEAQMHQFEKQQQEIAKQRAVIAKLKQFNREKSLKRARSREKLLNKMEVTALPTIDDQAIRFTFTPQVVSGQDVLSVNKLKKVFEDHPLFENISFEIKKGDKVAIVGPNGIGKTTLFKILMDTVPPTSGTYQLGAKVLIGYYDQEHATLNPNHTIIEEIQESFPNLNNSFIRNVLAAFLFTGEDVFKPIQALSGGERGRVALTKIMLSKANFLILDEPTNHLDILSKEALENAISAYEGTVLYVSHDRYFINQTATKVLEMSATSMTEYLGDYDYYLEKKKEADTPTPEVQTSLPDSKKDWQKQKEFQAQLKKIKNRIDTIEKEIEDFEAQIIQIDEDLCKEEIYTDFTRSQSLIAEKETLQQSLTDHYSEWETLSDTLADLEK